MTNLNPNNPDPHAISGRTLASDSLDVFQFGQTRLLVQGDAIPAARARLIEILIEKALVILKETDNETGNAN